MQLEFTFSNFINVLEDLYKIGLLLFYILKSSQTRVNDHPPNSNIATISISVPNFRPQNNDHPSIMVPIFGTQGWLLYEGLTVLP